MHLLENKIRSDVVSQSHVKVLANLLRNIRVCAVYSLIDDVVTEQRSCSRGSINVKLTVVIMAFYSVTVSFIINNHRNYVKRYNKNSVNHHAFASLITHQMDR
jgi:hypothetical protein